MRSCLTCCIASSRSWTLAFVAFQALGRAGFVHEESCRHESVVAKAGRMHLGQSRREYDDTPNQALPDHSGLRHISLLALGALGHRQVPSVDVFLSWATSTCVRCCEGKWSEPTPTQTMTVQARTSFHFATSVSSARYRVLRVHSRVGRP